MCPASTSRNTTTTAASGDFAPTRPDVPTTIEPSVIDDLDSIPLPTGPIVPFVECVHDRIAIEIMRGCPWQCRFCQSTVIKRPLRIRAGRDDRRRRRSRRYRNTGFNEISLLSLSTSDYPHFEQLLGGCTRRSRRWASTIALPSLRVNEQLKTRGRAVGRRSPLGLTLAPEVARDDMREQIRKKIKNEDLYDGCREAFRHGWQQVKLYFLCGLPGERPVDLDGIVEMAETISQIGTRRAGPLRQGHGQRVELRPQGPHAVSMERHAVARIFPLGPSAHADGGEIQSVNIKCHGIETSLLEGIMSRGDRRVAAAR